MAAAVAAFFPALALGSFLNVVAARVPLRRSVVRPASACMACATPIARRDNIPLYSYVRLRGRCRACGVRIPLRYPAVELATALLVAGCVVPVALLLGMVAALVPSAVLLARHGAGARKMGIPLAPFLALGTVVGLFAG